MPITDLRFHALPGEFTMIELAETVKEVSFIFSHFFGKPYLYNAELPLVMGFEFVAYQT